MTTPAVPEVPPTTAPAPPQTPIFETLEAIVGVEDRPMELVMIPEWRGGVRVRAFASSDRDSLEGESMAHTRPGQKAEFRYQDFRARVAVRAIVDAKGDRVFQDADWSKIAGKSAAALDRIAEVALRLSRMGQADVDKIVGESDAARPFASPTD